MLDERQCFFLQQIRFASVTAERICKLCCQFAALFVGDLAAELVKLRCALFKLAFRVLVQRFKLLRFFKALGLGFCLRFFELCQLVFSCSALVTLFAQCFLEFVRRVNAFDL